MKDAISKIKAREILDSRGNPTIEVEVITKGGAKGLAPVPSGASVGKFESVELRDGGRRYHGKGILKAITSVNEVIAPKIIGLDVKQQNEIDSIMIELDTTKNKSKLGGNAIIGVSLACAKAAATSMEVQLYEYIGESEDYVIPIPFFNIINGGKHAGNDLDFQEFIVVPLGANTYKEAVRIGSEIYHSLRIHLMEMYGKAATNVGDEGGFSPPISNPKEALNAILLAIEEMGYGSEAALAMDVAATTFYRPGGYYTIAERKLNTGELIDYYQDLVTTYPLVSIEDPLRENDFKGFADLTKKLKIQILGDDLFVTNTVRLKKGIEMGAANALIWKINQVGTLKEAFDTVKLAKKNGYAIQASHRSGETEDTSIADLAVGIGCGQIKTGAPCRGERTAKYNRLLRIEESLNGKARYPNSLKI